MKKYYIDRYGNYCSYDYVPNFTEEDQMTEITEEEYYAVTANEANEADYIAALERFGVE
mgnify:CR=1 FL=1